MGCTDEKLGPNSDSESVSSERVIPPNTKTLDFLAHYRPQIDFWDFYERGDECREETKWRIAKMCTKYGGKSYKQK
ncbi:hypothetical protein KIN20_028266 [Parelaphostrongylus tenuis]|uniref:Uncharacterized protein n=1 Tax=Parelaphostrongylus tenuis TaxID=148309 RepID=A0AAD5R0P6_PARTN|nr:hypothetical protein KIN20_028266 [Parelaphostrongylus tenuis]